MSVDLPRRVARAQLVELELVQMLTQEQVQEQAQEQAQVQAQAQAQALM